MSRKVGSTRPLKGIVLSVLLLALVAGLPVPAFSQTAISPPQVARELSEAFAATAKATMPAVVSIKIEKIVTARPGFGDSNDTSGSEDFLRRFFGVPPQGALRRGICSRGRARGSSSAGTATSSRTTTWSATWTG